MRTRALYYDGRSAKAHPVDILLDSDALGLTFTDGSEIIWPAASIRFVEPPTATTPLRLRRGFAGNERLVLADNRHANVLKNLYPSISKGDTLLRQNAKRLLIWGGAAVASLVFTVWVAIPILAGQVVDSLPPSFENRMGQKASEQIIKTVALFENRNPESNLLCGTAKGAARRSLETLLQRLAPGQPDGLGPTIQIVDLNMQNAFALPGGHIILFRGLLDSMQDPDELAGVLAHELGHLAYRHSTRVFIEQTGTSVLIGLLFGDVTGGAALAGIGQALLNSAHTREAEQQADAYALALLNREDINGRGMARFFERLAKNRGGLENSLSLLNSHPMSADRAAYFRDRASGRSASMSNDAWKSVKSICRTPPASSASLPSP